METYIKVEDLKKFPIRIDHYDEVNGSKDFVLGAESVIEYAENLPAADVEPVIRAHWDMVEREGFWTSQMKESLKTGKPTKCTMPVCSHCKTEFGRVVLGYKRCPECGAKMDKEPQNECQQP